MIDKIIDTHLEKQGFIRVPSSWTEDYKTTVDKLRASNQMIREIGREYNMLLSELAHIVGVKHLRDALKEIEIDVTGIKGEELIKLYIDTFAITFDEDYELEV